MNAYIDIPQTYTEDDENTEAFYGMKAREMELREMVLSHQYKPASKR